MIRNWVNFWKVMYNDYDYDDTYTYTYDELEKYVLSLNSSYEELSFEEYVLSKIKKGDVVTISPSTHDYEIDNQNRRNNSLNKLLDINLD